MSSALIWGHLAIDKISTLAGKMKLPGGSGFHASPSSYFFTPTHLVSRTGSDFPKSAISMLVKKGVNMAHVELLPGKSNLWEADCSDQSHHITRFIIADISIAPEELKLPLPASDYAFISEGDPDTQLSLLDLLPRGTKSLVDTKQRWVLPPYGKTIKKVIGRSAFAMMNSEEASVLFGSSGIDGNLDRMLQLGAEVAIINMASRGSRMKYGSTVFAMPAINNKPVNTVGAGDSFAGGFLGALSLGRALEEALVLGQVMASFKVEDYGSRRFYSLHKSQIFRRFQNL